FEARNPFGDGQAYFSKPVSARGPYAFALTEGKRDKPDQTPPLVSIASPTAGSRIAGNGFVLNGYAEDNEAISEVRLQLRLPSGRMIEQPASYRLATRSWRVSSGALPTDEIGKVTATIVAFDKALNRGEATIELNLIRDTAAPVMKVSSHVSGAEVPKGGFIIHGMIEDEALGSTLYVELSGGGMASGWKRFVDVDQDSGRWALVVAPEQSFDGTSLMLKLSARDASGNSSVQSLSLRPTDLFGMTWHALLRTSFGVSPKAYDEALKIGINTYLKAQLSPAAGHRDGYEQRQGAWQTSGTELSTEFLRRSVFSDHQLLEVMTWFWDNHFSTNYATHSNSDFEKSEQDAFRENAFGNFRTLLGLSARSPAMLYTLDGRLNRKGRLNENYARELLELHSMGVDGGYTQRDVEETARALTGWTVKDGGFYFSDVWHDFESKFVLGMAIPAGGGISDGELVLDRIASHSSTAQFICSKLSAFFVADNPPVSLVARCAGVFRENSGSVFQMRSVVSEIISSPEFLGEQYRQAKIKTPLEYVIGAVRNLDGEFQADDLGIEIYRQGMPLFRNPSPAGYSDAGRSWVTTGMLQSRARFSERLLRNAATADQTQFDMVPVLVSEGGVTAEGVVGRILERLLGPTFNRHHFDIAIGILTEDGSYPWWHGADDNEQRVRRLGRMLMNLPEYHYQ
ncbi:MAG: DUF1800 family protein, partial [Desulforhabdus sp.]|nr:DUF1800 family protein [Desulforhabdus sp.]